MHDFYFSVHTVYGFLLTLI